MIDFHHVFAEIKNVVESGDVAEGIAGGWRVGSGEFGEEVLDVGGGDRINVGDGGAVCGARAGRAVAVGPLCTDDMIELAVGHARVRDGRGRVSGSDDSAGFLGNKEEGFVSLLIDFGNPHRSAERSSEVVVAQLGSRNGWVHGIIEKAVGVEVVVAEELVEAAVNVGGAGAGDHVDLGASGTSGLGVIGAANHAELADGINAGERKQGEVRPAIHVIRPVDLPVVFFAAVSVDLEGHHVRSDRRGRPGENLVGIARIRRARNQQDELRIVPAV